MPHFSMADGRGWLLNLGFYFGANRELKQPGNEKEAGGGHGDPEFIASEEGQALLVEDGLGMMPATVGAKIPDDPVLEEIRTQIASGRYIMRPTYDMFSPCWRRRSRPSSWERRTAGRSWRNAACCWSRAPPVQALGEAGEDFTILQSGCLKADALRAAAGTDVALMGISEVNGYDPVGRSDKAVQGFRHRRRCHPYDPGPDGHPSHVRARLRDGEELLSLLEHGATSEEEQRDGGPDRFHPFAVSGLKLTYHLDKDDGNRGLRRDPGGWRQGAGGRAVHRRIYPGAFSEGQFGEMATGISMTDAFRDYIIAEKRVAPDKDRIQLES